MDRDGTQQKPKYPSWSASVAILLLYIGILVFGALFYQQLEEIDDKLVYTPPVAADPAQFSGLVPQVAGLVYLPVYSHIYSDNAEAVPLETTLSLRNTDPSGSIVIVELSYYDSQGKQLAPLSKLPLQIAPLASAELVISTTDSRGGTGANLLLKWKSEQQVSQPIFEAVMVAASQRHSFAFTSRGVPVTHPHQ